MNNVKSLKEIVKQLRSCGFTCEAGPLENNVDFQMLERIAGYVPAEHEFGEGERTLESAVDSAKKALIGAGEVIRKNLEGNPYIKSFRVRSLQEIRDDIIEQAKRDVAELSQLYCADDDEYLYLAPSKHGCYAEYIINRDKRTVVALLRGPSSQRIYSRGIAKCAPDDCFNVHIGKAIALRRALGLEVPAEYLNAPHPTEVRDGDVIRAIHRKIGSFHVIGRPNMAIINSDLQRGVIKVIDDSREEVSE